MNRRVVPILDDVRRMVVRLSIPDPDHALAAKLRSIGASGLEPDAPPELNLTSAVNLIDVLFGDAAGGPGWFCIIYRHRSVSNRKRTLGLRFYRPPPAASHPYAIGDYPTPEEFWQFVLEEPPGDELATAWTDPAGIVWHGEMAGWPLNSAP